MTERGSMDMDHDVDGRAPELPRILRDLADGCLADAEADAVVDWVRATGFEVPPSHLVNRAVRIAGQAGAGRAPRPTIWRRLVAVLMHDSRLHPRAAGARTLESGPPRLRYEVAGIEVDLEVGEGSVPDRVRVLGQVTASEPDLVRAWVATEGPGGRLEATVDTLGQFSLDGLERGAYRIDVGLVRALIEIPELLL